MRNYEVWFRRQHGSLIVAYNYITFDFLGFNNLLHSWLSFNYIFPYHLPWKWYQYKARGGKDQQVWAEQFLLPYKLYEMKSKVLFYNNSIRQILEWIRLKLFVWSGRQTGEHHLTIYLQYWCRHVPCFCNFCRLNIKTVVSSKTDF